MANSVKPIKVGLKSLLTAMVASAVLVHIASNWLYDRNPDTGLSQTSALTEPVESPALSKEALPSANHHDIDISVDGTAVENPKSKQEIKFAQKEEKYEKDGYGEATAASIQEFPAPEAIQSADDVVSTILFLKQVDFASTITFLDAIRTQSAENVYLSAIYKAGVQQLADVNFDEVLDYTLTNLNTNQANEQYWNDLSLQILAQKDSEYVSQSVALVANVFNEPGNKEAFNNLAVTIDAAAVATQALQHIRNVGSDSGQYELLSDALNKWVLTDPQAALAFAQNEFTDPAEQQEYLSDIFYNWMEHRPNEASSVVLEFLDQELALEPEAYSDLAILYVTETSKHDPASAYSWLIKQEDEVLRETALPRLLSNWVQTEDANLLIQFTQIYQQELGDIISSDLQHQLTEDILVALVDQGKHQQALDWINSHEDPQMVQWGQTVLKHLSARL